MVLAALTHRPDIITISVDILKGTSNVKGSLIIPPQTVLGGGGILF